MKLGTLAIPFHIANIAGGIYFAYKKNWKALRHLIIITSSAGFLINETSAWVSPTLSGDLNPESLLG